MFSKLLFDPFVDSFPFFENHQDPRWHRFRLECGWKSLVGASTSASPTVGKTEGITRVLFPEFNVVIDDFFDEHR